MLFASKLIRYLFLGSALLQADIACFAQTALDSEKWAIELNKQNAEGNESAQALGTVLEHTDSAKAFQFLNALSDSGKTKGYHFQAHFNCIKARLIFVKNTFYEFYQERKSVDQNQVKAQITALYTSALDMAYRSEDNYLIAYVSYTYASVIVKFGETGLSVMYAKNGIDLYEKLDYPVKPEYYQFLSEMLYKVKEYDESIVYGKKAIVAWQSSSDEYKRFTISSINTVALGYHRQHDYDSAFVYYNKALQLTEQTKDTVWTGIISGNMGQVYYAQGNYDTAYALLKTDYRISNNAGYYDNAANSLQWAARANLALGNKAAALSEVREAFQLLKLWPDDNYLRNAYYTTTQVHRELGAFDSAFYYNNLYSKINDLLEKEVATSSLSITKAKLNDETSQYQIQSLNKEKRSQLLLRNVIIACIVLLSVIALLFINRKRLITQLRMEKMEQEKRMLQLEIASAKDQLTRFTTNIIEKTNMIEQLEQQVKGNEATVEQQSIISELSRQTILTEDDWTQFKLLFETVYPSFFYNLKDKFSDITEAEQRMAALTRLRLGSKQMASMLGISVDSVHKSRQRLRQRFHIGTDTNLDDIVATL